MRTFNIFGLKYKQKTVDLKDAEFDGLCCHKTQTILIDKGQKGDDFNATLLHELGHAMFNATGMKQTSIHGDIEELIVENFSKIVIQNFDIKLKK